MVERSLVILKPDALERNLSGKIIQRFEAKGLQIIAANVRVASDTLLREHYPDTLAPTIGKKSQDAGTDVGSNPTLYGLTVLEWNRNYMSRGPVLAMVWQGEQAIQTIRNLIGHTDPAKAAPGTIRGDLGADTIAKANEEQRGTENLVHASGSREEAEHEIMLWFPELS